MPVYKAPLRDMKFLINEVFDYPKHYASLKSGENATPDIVDAILTECAKFCEEQLSPLFQSGDEEGCTLKDGAVVTPKGYKEAYDQFVMGGCSGPVLSDYAERGPKLVPESFFSGELTARGVVKNRSGEVIRTFDADISASWDSAGVGTLDEEFRFDDGEVQTRVWTLTPTDATDGYHADAGDVTEPGTMRWSGNAIHMNYVLQVAYGDGSLDVRMDDWMYLVTPDTLINQTTMSKWGIDVGELVLVIQKK